MIKGLTTSVSIIVLLVSLAGSARADIIFGTGNSSANKNIGSYTEVNSTTAIGHLLGSGTDALLAVSDVGLTAPAAGAARIEAAGTLFTTVIFNPLGPNWSVFEMNPQNARTSGTFVLKVLDNTNTLWTSGAFNLGNGENRVWAQGINGQSISQITIEASGALIQDIRQVRLTQATAIPEPSTIAFLGVAGLVGLGLLRRRRKLAA